MTNDIWSRFSGTHLQGSFIATRNEITKVFGEPTGGDGDKVTTEWLIVFPDDTVATVYDWKRYSFGAPEPDEVYDWHIGGADYTAVDHVIDQMNKVLPLQEEAFHAL